MFRGNLNDDKEFEDFLEKTLQQEIDELDIKYYGST